MTERYGGRVVVETQEATGLFNNGGSLAPEDPYRDDDFVDDDHHMARSTSMASFSRTRRGRFLGALLICVGCVGIGIAAAVVLGGGGSEESDSSKGNAVAEPAAPTPVTVAPAVGPPTTVTAAPTIQTDDFPTPGPTASYYPTITGAPTRPLYWEQRSALSDATMDALLLGSALDLSADGSVAWLGAFNYTDSSGAASLGRIRRLDTATGSITAEVHGQTENDSLGYQVSGSADGSLVAGLTSSNGVLTVWRYDPTASGLRVHASAALPTSWSFYHVFFALSADGQWLAVTGHEILAAEPGLTSGRYAWKLRIYQVPSLTSDSSSELVAYGPDMSVQDPFQVEPTLYAIDITADGAVVALATVGVEGTQGRVRVYKRQATTYTILGDANEALLQSNIAPGPDDFYARHLQIRQAAGQIWLAVGWESQNEVLVRRFDGVAWQDAGMIVPGLEFGAEAEFGYDLDWNVDATRMIVGVRCYNECQGATQVFYLNDGGLWVGLGQIIVGYPATFFGESVAMSADGTTIMIGAPEECNDNFCGGAIYVYTYEGPPVLDGSAQTATPGGLAAPTHAPAVVSATSVPTSQPTLTMSPTFSFGWAQINGIFESVDDELFAAAVSLSGDGNVLFVGAFENAEFAPSSGRILRVDLAADNAELVVYGGAYDFLGFDVTGSADGTRAVGYRSSDAVVEVVDYDLTTGLTLSAELATNLNSTSATFSLSSDGKWIAVVGVMDESPEVLTVKAFQDSGGGAYNIMGDTDLTLDLESMLAPPTLDIHLVEDGSFMAISVAGWDGYTGLVRVYQRVFSNWVLLGSPLQSDIVDDFYGKTVRLSQTSEGLLLLFIGAPYRNSVLVYQWNDSEWTPYGTPIVASLGDFGDQDEFGFDIDTSHDGSRVVVGVRCFDSCRGAAQVWEYEADGTWAPLGQILAGFAESYFGEAVDCNGDCTTLAVGAPEDCGDDGCGGAVYIFEEVDNRNR